MTKQIFKDIVTLEVLLMLGFIIGFLYGSLLEYWIHRFIFHKLGRKKGSLWSYHLKGHHKLSRRDGFFDLTESKAESVGMMFLVLIHTPLFFVSFGLWLGEKIYEVALGSPYESF